MKAFSGYSWEGWFLPSFTYSDLFILKWDWIGSLSVRKALHSVELTGQSGKGRMADSGEQIGGAFV